MSGIHGYSLPKPYSLIRVGQNHMNTVYIRYVWQGDHQMYDLKRCTCAVLAIPKFDANTV
jgi:hypothetical protein